MDNKYDKTLIGLANNNRGFTLIELLIVLAIVGLLAGMSFPAIQSFRESSRRTGCLNNLRQLSTASANYESSHRHLPPGTLGFAEQFEFDLYGNWLEPTSQFYWKRAQHSSFVIHLLPLLERENLNSSIERSLFDHHRLLDDSQGFLSGKYTWFGDTANFVMVASTVLPLLHCPSDDMEAAKANSDLIVVAGSQPVAEGLWDGFAWIGLTTGNRDVGDLPPGIYDEAIDADFALTNYLGCSGAHSGGQSSDPEKTPYNGMMNSRKPIRLAEVNDGLSNTVVFGESVGQLNEGKRRIAQNWMIGGLARMRGSIPWMLETHPNQWHWRHLGDGQNSSAFGFGSKHSMLVNFAFGDGSVRSISRDVDWKVLYQIAGIADGSVAVPLD